MTRLVLQREYFTEAKRLSPMWTLAKAGRTATCELWSHSLGFELRLTIDGDDMPRTQVCHSQEELIATQDEWRAKLEAQDWVKASC